LFLCCSRIGGDEGLQREEGKRWEERRREVQVGRVRK